MIDAPLLLFDDVFASTGIFGIELGHAAHALADTTVAMRGYLSGPILANDAHFVLSRSPLPQCPFCSNHNHWPDDAVVVAFERTDTVPEIDDAIEHVVIGRLETGECRHESGLTSNARLLQAAIV